MLAEVFAELEKYYTRQQQLRQQFRRQLTWPVVQFVLAIGIVAGLILILGFLQAQQEPGARPYDPLGLRPGRRRRGVDLPGCRLWRSGGGVRTLSLADAAAATAAGSQCLSPAAARGWSVSALAGGDAFLPGSASGIGDKHISGGGITPGLARRATKHSAHRPARSRSQWKPGST